MTRRERAAAEDMAFDALAYEAGKREKASKVDALYEKCNKCLQPLGGLTVKDLRKHREICPKQHDNVRL